MPINIFCLFSHYLVTAPHDLQVENPFDCPSLFPYVHVLPSVDPHDLQASLYSCPAAGGSPNVGIFPIPRHDTNTCNDARSLYLHMLYT